MFEDKFKRLVYLDNQIIIKLKDSQEEVNKIKKIIIDKSETNYININGRNIYLNEYIKKKSLKKWLKPMRFYRTARKDACTI